MCQHFKWLSVSSCQSVKVSKCLDVSICQCFKCLKCFHVSMFQMFPTSICQYFRWLGGQSNVLMCQSVTKFLNYRCVDVSMFHVSVSICQEFQNYECVNVSNGRMCQLVNLSRFQMF